MTKVLVLGAQGMLGSMVTRVLAQQPGLEVTATTRAPSPGTTAVRWRRFDARSDSLDALLRGGGYGWLINAIAVIAPRIEPAASPSVRQAIEINSLFPRLLAERARDHGQRVIQIATDGVYSGAAGPYDERAPHDASDIYGQTKSLGEVTADNVVSLRCSIVGPELAEPRSLLGRILASETGATVPGFTGQLWNGVTSLHLARICTAIVEGVEVREPQHLVPADAVTKAGLLQMAVRAFARSDLRVMPEYGPGPSDRRLTTVRPEVNRRLWAAAGYRQPPTISSMLDELAAAGPW